MSDDEMYKFIEEESNRLINEFEKEEEIKKTSNQIYEFFNIIENNNKNTKNNLGMTEDDIEQLRIQNRIFGLMQQLNKESLEAVLNFYEFLKI